jgi:hypothetical protein
MVASRLARVYSTIQYSMTLEAGRGAPVGHGGGGGVAACACHAVPGAGSFRSVNVQSAYLEARARTLLTVHRGQLNVVTPLDGLNDTV